MEDALFSDGIFKHVDDYTHEEADHLNDETFGLCDDDEFTPDDWEKHHEENHRIISKLMQSRSELLNSPSSFKPASDESLTISSTAKFKPNDVELSKEFSSSPISSFATRRQPRHVSLSDEEDIIENSISSLGLDDDYNYVVKSDTPSKSIAFEESHQSWTSPIRGAECRSDSLQELISPGDGVWASPSSKGEGAWTSPSKEGDDLWTSPFRETLIQDSLIQALSPSREGDSLWTSPSREGDGFWASPSREGKGLWTSPLAANTAQDDKQYNEDMLRQLTTRDEDTFKNIPPPPTIPTPSVIALPLIPNTCTHQTPTNIHLSTIQSKATPSAIRVEDLERELKKESKPPPPIAHQPTIIERHTPKNQNLPRHALPLSMGNEFQMKNLFPGQAAVHVNRMASMMMFNQQMNQMTNYSPLMCRPPAQRVPPPLLPPYYLTDPQAFFPHPEHVHNYRQKIPNWSARPHTPNRDRQYRSTWHKEMRPPNFKEIDYEQFIQMGPSKMMDAREKKWIFKISLMSLLGGDPNTSDYYFISLLTKNFLSEAESKMDEEIRKKLEKSNELVNYAQQQQQTKESHKPVKFKGSLGKLSITSVHHPRLIMDFSAEQQHKGGAHDEYGGKKKFMLYGIVEKMYSLLLQIHDMERELSDNKQGEDTTFADARIEKLNELFQFFSIQLHTSQAHSDTTHFANLMSICKARKLLTRVILLFNQEQCESLLVSMMTVLPSLLKKDKEEENFLQLNGKLSILLKKSTKKFKLKCIKLLRKIDLHLLLTYSTGILLLCTLLNCLDEKKRGEILEWSYYMDEVPKALLTLPESISPKSQVHLTHLKEILGLDNLLGVNIT